MAFGFAQPASGLIADRLLLPDRQHRFMIDFARAYADDVTVVVCGRSTDIIPWQARTAWMRERFPDIAVLRAFVDTPHAPAGDARASALQRERIADSLGSRRFDLLFAIDTGDRLLADRVGAQFVPCFPVAAMMHAPDSAPGLDAHPVPAAMPLKRVCLFGPESTGKSTLATQLAGHYRTVHVPEYVRGYLDAIGSTGTVQDVPWIARGQRAAELAGAAQADRILICDTNLATVALWSDVLFGATPGWIRDEAARNTYDLWLLTDIDVPFEPDPQRCFPEPAQRAWFFDECRRTLDRLGIAPVLLRGSPEARLALACEAIDRMLD
jgi:HTH-type transcriptional regulator, transcriptional repressor of NAD biosynthesis genes